MQLRSSKKRDREDTTPIFKRASTRTKPASEPIPASAPMAPGDVNPS